MNVDAGGAADFPGHGAEGASGGRVEEHGLECGAVPSHFFVGGCAGFRGRDGGEG